MGELPWRVTFWASGAAFAFLALPLGFAIGAEGAESWVRSLAVSMATGTCLLAFVPGFLYQHRFHTASLLRRNGMLSPADIWGMAFSYIVILIPLNVVVLERLHEPHFPSLATASLISSALAWRWYCRLIGRQLRLTPEPTRSE